MFNPNPTQLPHPTPTLDARRRVAGLCIDCGVVRVGDGITPSRCAACAERDRAKQRRYRERLQAAGKPGGSTRARIRRRAAGQCTECGVSLAPGDGDFLVCAACRARASAAHRARRPRTLDRRAGIPEGVDRHFPVGAHEYLAGESRCHTFHLNHAAQTALFALHRAYREAELAAGRRPKSRILSHLIREVIRPWHDRAYPLTAVSCTINELQIIAHLDGPCRATIDRIARESFDGNRSAALRALLVDAAHSLTAT